MKNTNILIVDEKIDLVEPLGEIFERIGYSVTMVEDGDKAIGLLKRRNFDILLTPSRLPGASGAWDYKIMKRLCPSMAVIIVNSVREKKETAEILESEIEAVVDKPFNVKKLMETVDSVLKAPSILIVDHRLQDRQALKNMLAEGGYRALVAKDAREAMEMVRESDFDIVILDVGVEGTDGVEVIEAVKKIKPDIEVIMMIDYSTVRCVEDLLRKGAYTCLYKPFLDTEKLIRVIEEMRSQSIRAGSQYKRETGRREG